MKNLLVEIKQVYGNELIYPLCANAKLFAAIAEKKTLSRDAIEKIKALGYSVEVKQQNL